MLPIAALLVSGFAHHATRHLPARAAFPPRGAFPIPTVVADGQASTTVVDSGVRPDHHMMDTTAGAASTRALSVIMKSSDLTDTSAFTASVLGIVGGQLGFTALASSIMAQPGPVHDLALTSPSLWPVFLVTLVAAFAALETESLVWLCAFTAAESWIVGLIVMQYVDAGLGNLIGLAVFRTAITLLCIGALGAGLRVALWPLLAGCCVVLPCRVLDDASSAASYGLIFLPVVPMQSLTLCVVGSVGFSLYLAYDLSMTRSEYAEDNRSVAASLAICMCIALPMHFLALPFLWPCRSLVSRSRAHPRYLWPIFLRMHPRSLLL